MVVPKFFLNIIADLCRNGIPSYAYVKYHLQKLGIVIKAALPYLYRLLGKTWTLGFIDFLGGRVRLKLVLEFLYAQS